MDVCSIQQVHAGITLAVRGRVTEAGLPAFMNEKMTLLMGYLREKGIRPAGFTYICFNNMDLNDWEIEAGVPVAKPDGGEGEIVPSSLPACLAATTMHLGGSSGMKNVYWRLKSWMAENNYEEQGPMYEICLNDPRFTPPEETYWGMWIPLKS